MPTAADVSGHLRDAVLARLTRLTRFDDGVPLVGTTGSLASDFGVTSTALLSALRDLLEAGRIVVEMEPAGRLSIRLDDLYAAPALRLV